MKIAHFIIASALFVGAVSVNAATIEIKGKVIEFDPAYVRAQVGDVISFTNMTGHFVKSIDSMVPEGAKEMLSKMGENYTYTIEKEGVYFLICPPHWGARMGAFIVVGGSENIEPILAKYEEVIAQDKSLSPAGKLIKQLKEKIKNGAL